VRGKGEYNNNGNNNKVYFNYYYFLYVAACTDFPAIIIIITETSLVQWHRNYNIHIQYGAAVTAFSVRFGAKSDATATAVV